MKTFFEPRTVALIGASANPVRPGNHIFMNIKYTLGDNVYPVNPREEKIEGSKCYPSVLDIPAEIDVAVIFIPAKGVPEALEQCAEKGIKRVIIESAGFSEAGDDGRALNEKCMEIARRNNMRLWGPNCMGMINVHQMKVLSFLYFHTWQGKFIPGSASLVVQSGMLSAGFLTQILNQTPFGLSKICSVGNKMDVDESDILEYLIKDPQTQVIGMYLESINNGRRFFDLCKSTDKPIAVLKSGRSELGAKAAASHTASMAQNDRIIGSALKQAGVIRVIDMNELMDVVRSLQMYREKPLKKARIGILTFSGGAGVVTTDFIVDYGMEVARFSDATIKRIKGVFPEWMNPSNPVDLYPAIEKNGVDKAFHESIEAAVNDPGVDAIYLHLFTPASEKHLLNFDHISSIVKKSGKPMVVWTIGDGSPMNIIYREFDKRGIPVLNEIWKGARVLAALTMRR